METCPGGLGCWYQLNKLKRRGALDARADGAVGVVQPGTCGVFSGLGA